MRALEEEKKSGTLDIEQQLVDLKNGLTDLGQVKSEELRHS